MESLVYTKPRHPNNHKPIIHIFLCFCEKWRCMYIVANTIYLGPFLVLNRKEKYYALNIKQRPDSVRINRLKPAHMVSEFMSDSDDNGNSSDADISPEIQIDPGRLLKEANKMPATEVYSRCGRQIHFSRLYRDYCYCITVEVYTVVRTD